MQRKKNEGRNYRSINFKKNFNEEMQEEQK